MIIPIISRAYPSLHHPSLKVDGDSDSGQVLRELRRCIHREIASLRRERAVDSTDERKDVVGKLSVAMNVSYLCGSTEDS